MKDQTEREPHGFKNTFRQTFCLIFFFYLSKILLEETEPSDHDSDPEDSQSQGGRTVWRKGKRKTDEEELAAPLVSAVQPIMCHLLALPLERSGRETPVSVDSIPLEWDHTVDVGGSSSHEDDDEDDATFFSTLSGKKWPF